MSQPIVVGFDGSDRSHDALALARELSSVLAADLILVNAYTPEDRLWAWGTAPMRAEEELRQIAAAADSELAGHVRHVVRSVSSPSAAGALHATAESEDAQLIVVGSSRHGALGRVLLGTVTQSVLDAAPCAVLVAPAGSVSAMPVRLARIGVGFDDTPEARIALEVAHGLAVRTGGSARDRVGGPPGGAGVASCLRRLPRAELLRERPPRGRGASRARRARGRR